MHSRTQGQAHVNDGYPLFWTRYSEKENGRPRTVPFRLFHCSLT